MTPELVKIIIDALFDELEKRFANRPLILTVLNVLQAVAESLIPLVLAKAEGVAAAKGVKPQ